MTRVRRIGGALAIAGLVVPTALGLIAGESIASPRLDLGWDGVVEQTASNSCGPAVVATLAVMRGRELTESNVLAEARLERDGVSLAEFARLAHNFGFQGQWLRVSQPEEHRSFQPGTVLHLRDFSGHFVIVLEDHGNFVLLADPASGKQLVSRASLLQRWTGRIFLLDRPV